jgi:hypothetical protein
LPAGTPAIAWPTLQTVCAAAADYFGRAPETLSGDTRLDELSRDESLIIHFTWILEIKLHCDIPDLDIETTLTLAQIATLAEKYKVSRDD